MNFFITRNQENSLIHNHPNDMFSSLFFDIAKVRSGNLKIKKVPIFRTQDFFDSIKLSEIGIISIDVEGFETEIINGINFLKTRIRIAVIENNIHSKFGSDEVRKIMHKNGFIFYARIWGLDDIYINRRAIEK